MPRKSSKKRRKRSDRQILTKKIDTLAKLYCRQQADFTCAVCGKKGTGREIHAHHIVGAKNKRLRWDQRNLICLCAGHHKLFNESAHEDVLWFREWREENIWEDELYLHSVKNEIKKWSIDEMEKLYKDLKKKTGEGN